jgi:hypothetical protein
MESTTQHFRVPQLQWDDIKTVRFQKFDERRLISIDHDQIRINAKHIHIDPIAANALGQVFGPVFVGMLHRWAVNDFPLFQDVGH